MRVICQKLNLFQSALAGLMGFSVRTIQDWERGRRKPSGSALHGFLKVEKRQTPAAGADQFRFGLLPFLHKQEYFQSFPPLPQIYRRIWGRLVGVLFAATVSCTDYKLFKNEVSALSRNFEKAIPCTCTASNCGTETGCVYRIVKCEGVLKLINCQHRMKYEMKMKE